MVGRSLKSWLRSNFQGCVFEGKGQTGKVYRACVQSVLVYGSETWPVKVEDMQHLERTERMMVSWMCGVSLKSRMSSKKLCEVGYRGNLGDCEAWSTEVVWTH